MDSVVLKLLAALAILIIKSKYAALWLCCGSVWESGTSTLCWQWQLVVMEMKRTEHLFFLIKLFCGFYKAVMIQENVIGFSLFIHLIVYSFRCSLSWLIKPEAFSELHWLGPKEIPDRIFQTTMTQEHFFNAVMMLTQTLIAHMINVWGTTLAGAVCRKASGSLESSVGRRSQDVKGRPPVYEWEEASETAALIGCTRC